MFFLLLCGVLSEWFQPGIIYQAHTSLAVRNDRMYKESPTNFMGQFFITLFRLGIITLALCLCGATDGRLPFSAFWAVFGMTIVLFVIKMVCNNLLDYTFMLTRRFGAPYEHYGNLFTLISLTLFPALLILFRVNSPEAAQWVSGIIAGIFILVWIYRMFRTYVISPMAVIYLLIYIFTLEILPFAGLVYLSAKTMSVL